MQGNKELVVVREGTDLGGPALWQVKASIHPAALHSVSAEAADMPATALLCTGIAGAL